MAITPNTNLRLIKVPIEIDNQNQINFRSKQAQYNYFTSLNYKDDIEDFTYQRKDSVIRYPANIDSIIEYNYVMYQNENYTDKWFYAFITDMTYVNDNMTLIQIKTDAYQTWQFDLIFKSCFVEREHVNNDTIGLHTIPEVLETGDYISCNLQPTLTQDIETCFVVGVSEMISAIGSQYSTLNQRLPVGIFYIGLTDLSAVQQLVRLYDNEGKGEAVNCVFVIPKTFFTSWFTIPELTGQISKTIKFNYSNNYTISKVDYLGDNYYPVNNKLYCYPYSFLQVSNHTGQIVNYKWENFNLLKEASTDTIEFTLIGTLTPSGSFKLLPRNYNNIINNNDDTINLGKYPIGAFNSDIYTNWLTQNGVNIAGIKLNAEEAGYAKGGIETLIGVASLLAGNPFGVGEVAQGVGDIYNTMQESYRHSLTPDNVEGNVNSGDVNFVFGLNNLEFKRMSIKNEYARVIDKFFSMFGYKVNEVKLPNITGRRNWNYIKTIDCNIEAYIPQEDLQEIKGMFNKGITIWHNTNTFLDYSQNNDII